MRNHTATHLLNWALRKVLGEHVEQKGSLVDAGRRRASTSRITRPLTAEEIAEVERLVNEKIYADLPVTPVTMPLAEAKKIAGVRAVFGEKYPDPVRVLLIGAGAAGGGDAGVLGRVLRRHAPEPHRAGGLLQDRQPGSGRQGRAPRHRRDRPRGGGDGAAAGAVVDELTGRFNCKPEELPAGSRRLQEEIKKLQQQLKKGAAERPGRGGRQAAGRGGRGRRRQGDRRRDAGRRRSSRCGSRSIGCGRRPAAPWSCIGWADDGKVGLLAAVTDDLVKKGLHAGKLVGEVAKVVGGGGGGKPTMAQAGGKDPAKLAEAICNWRRSWRRNNG